MMATGVGAISRTRTRRSPTWSSSSVTVSPARATVVSVFVSVKTRPARGVFEATTLTWAMLELVRGKRVDHPKRGSKDVSDALVNAMWLEVEYGGTDKELVFAGVGL